MMTGDCDDISAELGAWLDGALSPDESTALERHLMACPACRTEAAAIRALTQAVSSLADPQPSLSLRARVLAQAVADAGPSRVETRQTEGDTGRRIQRRGITPFPEDYPVRAEPFLRRVVQSYWRTTEIGITVSQTVQTD